jgi:hypothetical protein
MLLHPLDLTKYRTVCEAIPLCGICGSQMHYQESKTHFYWECSACITKAVLTQDTVDDTDFASLVELTMAAKSCTEREAKNLVMKMLREKK